jgi:chromosome segregation ATPase
MIPYIENSLTDIDSQLQTTRNQIEAIQNRIFELKEQLDTQRYYEDLLSQLVRVKRKQESSIERVRG